ncbi:multicopper oxidase domain-containing protein [Sulfurimonas sp. MAG313]|nr:multicopper oxidase domain-containing protein [Sulfurimonas sp. MAG313]MDF1881653.1 multicopper oxidase domain-containing protein [Sulfurimonas sp. MAG313]
MHRRNFIQLSAISAAVLVTGCTTKSDEALPVETGLISGSALFIPALLDPVADTNGVKQFNLSIKESTHKFYSEYDTKTYGIDASYLGPTLLLRQGEKVSINYKNELLETTTMHGHGMHLPAKMDGGPHQLIEVGATWSAQYTVNQNACTNWYHPHEMGKTADHVYMGLAGMIIVEDNESTGLGLPSSYGVDDIPLVIQDRLFDALGQFNYNPSNQQIMRGYRGDTIITNGQVSPIFDAKSGLLRLRLLNGSNAGLYRFSLADNRAFNQIAGDNSLLEKPVSITSVLLSPGERAEIIVDLSNDIGTKLDLMVNEEIDNLTKIALSINVQAEIADIVTLPNTLAILDIADATQAVNTRSFTLEGSGMGGPTLTINNKEMDMAIYNETVPLNQIEIWEITNTMNMPHNFHIHATHFRLIERNGSTSAVSETEKGYKDVVFIPANEKVKVLIQMLDYTDATSPYMYHCHFLEHEDAGMMGQFIVV